MMKVVDVCSGYGVRNIQLCNVRNRSTRGVERRRWALREYLEGCGGVVVNCGDDVVVEGGGDRVAINLPGNRGDWLSV